MLPPAPSHAALLRRARDEVMHRAARGEQVPVNSVVWELGQAERNRLLAEFGLCGRCGRVHGEGYEGEEWDG